MLVKNMPGRKNTRRKNALSYLKNKKDKSDKDVKDMTILMERIVEDDKQLLSKHTKKRRTAKQVMSINNKKISKKREHKIAKEMGGKAHIASGALWWKKGDASNDFFLIEDKFTTKDKYTLNIKTLKKIEKEAMNCGKIPVS